MPEERVLEDSNVWEIRREWLTTRGNRQTVRPFLHPVYVDYAIVNVSLPVLVCARIVGAVLDGSRIVRIVL